MPSASYFGYHAQERHVRSSNLITPFNVNRPRIFLVHEDGTGAELLSALDLLPYLRRAVKDVQNTTIEQSTIAGQMNMETVTFLTKYLHIGTCGPPLGGAGGADLCLTTQHLRGGGGGGLCLMHAKTQGGGLWMALGRRCVGSTNRQTTPATTSTTPNTPIIGRR